MFLFSHKQPDELFGLKHFLNPHHFLPLLVFYVVHLCRHLIQAFLFLRIH